jgi:hypothetical protein
MDRPGEGDSWEEVPPGMGMLEIFQNSSEISAAHLLKSLLPGPMGFTEGELSGLRGIP